jgi:hypothetical protein
VRPRRTRDPSRNGAALERLLEEQRTALLGGRLGDLAGITARLDALLAAQIARSGARAADAGAGMDASDADRLRRIAARNADLLSAARAGLARARAMREGAAGATHSTYTASGRLAPSTPVTGRTLSRR